PMSPLGALIMFNSRIHLRDHTLAQRLGQYVRVGQAFLFLGSDPADQEWMSWFSRRSPLQPSAGPLIVPLLASCAVEIPGGMIEPLRLPQLRLDGITTDKVIY